MATTARVIDLEEFRRRRLALAEAPSDDKRVARNAATMAATPVVWVPVWVWMPVWSVGM